MPYAFIANRDINKLNLHSTLQQLSQNIIIVFLGIYLYEQGLALWSIFLVIGAFFLIRMLVRPVAINWTQRHGLRASVSLGTLAYSTVYLLLGASQGLDIWLGLFLVVAAIAEAFYWLGYHTYFTELGDHHARGKQTSMREVGYIIAELIAPLGGALLIDTWGYWAAFIGATISMLLAILPLLSLPKAEVKESYDFSTAMKKINKQGLILFAGYAGFQLNNTVWKLILFLLLGNYVAFGGLLSLAVLIQVIGIMLVGHHFDKGSGKRLAEIGFIITAMVIIGRALFAYDIPSVIFFDVLFMIGYILVTPTLDSAFYNAQNNSIHPLWYQFFSEAGWDIGSIVSCSLVALIIYTTDNLRLAMTISVIGLIIMNNFLQGYFRNHTTSAKKRTSR